jgi:hypothetical protein
MSEKPFEQSGRRINYLVVGVGAGMVIGAGLGVALGNFDFGMALGVLFGAAFGTFVNHLSQANQS